MSTPEVSNTLKGQESPSHPLITILLGLVSHCDVVHSNFSLALQGEPIPECILDTQTFIEELGVRGLYTGMVLKLQRPLSTNAEVPTILAYNQDRSLLEDLTIDEGILSYFEDQYKVYVFARLWVNGTLQLVKPVPAEDW